MIHEIATYYDGVLTKGTLKYEVKYGDGQSYSRKVSGAGENVNALINSMIADAAVDILNYHKIRAYLVTSKTH